MNEQVESGREESASDRQWPAPDRKWSVSMTWSRLLFLHWPVSAEWLKEQLPPNLQPDLWEGEAWIGVVPFRMERTRHRPLPPLPGCSTFPELNVRTYVQAEDKPGVWFFSLDAASLFAVRAARTAFHLPYYHAEMSIEEDERGVAYTSRRRGGKGDARFAARYAPDGPSYQAEPGSIEYFLTARYCLYSCDRRGRLSRGEIDHPPWPLQAAHCDVTTNTMTGPLELQLPDRRPLAHYADRLDVVAWSLDRLG